MRRRGKRSHVAPSTRLVLDQHWRAESHAGANLSFVQYQPHANARDRKLNPALYFIRLFMNLLLAAVPLPFHDSHRPGRKRFAHVITSSRITNGEGEKKSPGHLALAAHKIRATGGNARRKASRGQSRPAESGAVVHALHAGTAVPACHPVSPRFWAWRLPGCSMRFSESFWAQKFAAGVGGFGAILFHKLCAIVLTIAFLTFYVKEAFTRGLLKREKGNLRKGFDGGQSEGRRISSATCAGSSAWDPSRSLSVMPIGRSSTRGGFLG